MELFKTNGTEAGTFLVKDIRPGSSNGLDSNFNNDKQIFVEFNGELYFRGSTNTSIELWKTDGTEVGTVSVKNFEASQTGAPSYVSNNDREYLGVVFNNQLYFTVNRASSYELWKTDGTTVGTVLIRGGFTAPISNMIVFNNQLFFTTTESATGNEIWVTDGTLAGTQLKHDIFPNNLNPSLGLGSNPDDFFIFNNSLYFSARGYDYGSSTIIGRELYKTDGTLSSLVKNINTTVSGSGTERSGLNSPKFKIFNNELYFIADSGSNNEFSFWKTDGTEAGTIEVVAVADTGESFQFNNANEYNGSIFYFNSQQLWVTDGTSTNTQVLTDINGLSNNILLAQSGSLISYDNKLWFEGYSSANGYEITSIQDTTLSNDSVLFQNAIILFPNPTRDLLNVSSNSQIEKIEVFNYLGQNVITTTKNKIDISQLTVGHYVLRIFSGKKIVSKKFIKY